MTDSAEAERPAFRRGVRLALDIGKARIGVARCDADGIMAVPVETIHRKYEPDDGIERIAELAEEHDAQFVIVGNPIALDGRSGIAARHMMAYAHKVAAAVMPARVQLVDERMTTKVAQKGLRDAGVSTRHHKSMVDQVAAVEILETALAYEKHTGNSAGRMLGGE